MRRLWVRALCAIALALCAAPISAQAASKDPLFIYTPSPGPPITPPAEGIEGPCGLAVDGSGDFYVSDYYHDTVDRFSPVPTYVPPQLVGVDPADGPCGLALDSAGTFYVGELHGAALRYTSFPTGARTTLDPGPSTGVAVDLATSNVYVDDSAHVSAYDSSGAPLEVGGEPLTIGEGSLESGYGIAVSGYPLTAGFLYVPDAGSDTVKVYDPSTDAENPVETIEAGFSSLQDAAIAVDDETGEVYVADDLQPETADEPEAAVYVFSAVGAYEGRLKYNVVDARPPGLAVDNSGASTQSRVYVTSGNSEKASIFAYPPHAVGSDALPAPEPPLCSPPGRAAKPPCQNRCPPSPARATPARTCPQSPGTRP